MKDICGCGQAEVTYYRTDTKQPLCAACATDARSLGVQVTKLVPCEAPTQEGFCGRPSVAKRRCAAHYYRGRRASRRAGAIGPRGGALSTEGRSPRITISLAPKHHARLLSEADAAGNTTSTHARLILERALATPTT